MNSHLKLIKSAFVISTLLVSQGGWAKSALSTEIHVTLLGQACLLRGPFDESTLKAVHSAGPAQLYPVISSPESPSAKEQTQKALTQLRGIHNLPSLLDRYREKLGHRLEAQVEFLSGLQMLLKDQGSVELNKIAKKYLRSDDLKNFETLLKKLQASIKTPPQRRDLSDQLFDLYNESIEKDPEVEFHRAIKRLNIQYVCSFEESDD